MKIDEIANEIVNSFHEENEEKLIKDTKEMLYKIKYDEGMFSVVRQPYLVAKSLYFMLTEDFLTQDQQMGCVKLAYYCLLNNYLNNINSTSNDFEYEELVSGCKLALVLISMQNQYIMYDIIAGQAGYINPDTHLRDQILLFSVIVKEAEISNCNFFLEDIIDDYFKEIVKEIKRQMPTGSDLVMLKEKVTPVLKNIMTSMSFNFKDNDDYYMS